MQQESFRAWLCWSKGRLVFNFFLSRGSPQKPERDEWGSGLEALECALQLEKSVNQSLLDMHKVASERNDPHVSTCPLAAQSRAGVICTDSVNPG